MFQLRLRSVSRLQRGEMFSERTMTPHSAASHIRFCPSAGVGSPQSRPAPLSLALSPYKADHRVSPARLLPTNALRGSPGRGLWAPPSPTPHPRLSSHPEKKRACSQPLSLYFWDAPRLLTPPACEAEVEGVFLSLPFPHSTAGPSSLSSVLPGRTG